MIERSRFRAANAEAALNGTAIDSRNRVLNALVTGLISAVSVDRYGDTLSVILAWAIRSE